MIAPVLILPSPISLPPAEIQAVEGGRPFRHHRINFWSAFSSQGDQIWRASNNTWGKGLPLFPWSNSHSSLFARWAREMIVKNKILTISNPHRDDFARNTERIKIHSLQNSCLCRTVGDRGKVTLKFWRRLQLHLFTIIIVSMTYQNKEIDFVIMNQINCVNGSMLLDIMPCIEGDLLLCRPSSSPRWQVWKGAVYHSFTC